MIYWLLGALGLTGGGIGIAALLGGGPAMLLAAKWLWSWLSHATFLQVACLALGVALAIDHMALLTAHHGERAWHKQFDDEHKGRIDDRAAYRKAQADAAAANRVQVAKVEQQSKKVSDDERQAYLRDLAQLRAARLRQQNAAPQGAPRSPGSPTAPASAGGANADGLSFPPSDDVRESAAEIELRLLHLQRWVEQQLAIDPNKP